MKMVDKHPLVFIVIITWNSREQLVYCLPTVVKTDYSNIRVLIVDNNSEDNTIYFVRHNYPDIEIITNTKNRGFAGGNNDGIKYALAQGANYIAIINPDIKVDYRWLKYAVKVMEEKPRIGFLGFNTFNEDCLEDEDGGLFEAAKEEWSNLIVKETSHISGCALFVRAEVFEKIGLFDEVYMSYAEESDFQVRGLKAGYEMMRINIPMWHYGMGSWSKVPLRASWYKMRNHLRYYLKQEGWRRFLLACIKLYNIACGDVRKIDLTSLVVVGMRSSNRLVNGSLLFAAILWNVIHLPRTLYIRRSEEKMIKRAVESTKRLTNVK